MSAQSLTPAAKAFMQELEKEFVPLLDGCFVLSGEKKDSELHWLGQPPRVYEVVDERGLERFLGKVQHSAAHLFMRHLATQVVQAPEIFHCPPDKPQVSDTPSVLAMEQNGVKRPKSGVTRDVWDTADRITALHRSHNEAPASRTQVVEACVALHINESTAASSYSKWAQFHGINPKDPSKPFVGKPPSQSEVLNALPLVISHPVAEVQDVPLTGATIFCPPPPPPPPAPSGGYPPPPPPPPAV